MKRGPYRTFSWTWALLWLCPVISALVWWGALHSNSLSDLETGAIVSLCGSTAGFSIVGIAVWISVTLKRSKVVGTIIRQDSRMMIVSDWEALRISKQINDFAEKFVLHRPLTQLAQIANRHLGYVNDSRRIDLKSIPFVTVRIEMGQVNWEWRGMSRKAAGTTYGSLCLVSYQETNFGMASLSNHELGHVVCQFGLGMWNMPVAQKRFMDESGMEGALYLKEFMNRQ